MCQTCGGEAGIALSQHSQNADGDGTWGRSAHLEPASAFGKIEVFLSRQSRAALWTEAVLLAAIIAVIDFAVTNEVNLAVFQLLPVMFATWYISRRAGITITFLTIGSWVATDIISGVQFSSAFVPYWNGAVRVTFFLIVITLTWVMRDAKSQAQELSLTDSLTGIANGRSFSDRATLEIARIQRTGRPLTLAYIDLDHFKQINDLRGHPEGDRLLQSVATAIAERLRGTDFVARLGGDEFAMLLPETDHDAAPRVLAAVAAAVTKAIDHDWGVGCTVGSVTFEEAPPSVDFMVRICDNLMLQGKRQGRGRVVHRAWPSDEDGES